ncbi:hypothetical protein P280DRAFT_468968 [Massarina eburnea CBS 473.64]|uniref:C3H1-type domain-containing protein n=1 Tax=Massarina eburnea CBS 473.64 TaxID=1395130 RepID=A0A6A6S2G2_9PLEO|nr:hypothetical protein P280DRAFT_468968 [Massarina eburnea CBS 473.64]
MPICSFYQRGNCKFGDNCKNEHPGSQRDSNRGFGGRGGGFGGGSSNNRFGGFSGDSYRPAQQSAASFGRNNGTPRFHLDKADIEADLSAQRPIYPLSCYGPGRDAPRQMIEGPVEISPEELRSRYYLARMTGNEVVAQQEESQLHARMEEQVKKICSDITGAMKYVEDGADIHPNRLDIVQAKAPAPADAPGTQPSSNPFQQPRLNAFGSAPQAPAQNTAFGQTSTPAFGGGSAFGQTSNPGQTTSAFGQPSALGFGKPSMPGATSAFGQPATLGRPSAFGQPSALGSTPAFGKPSNPGQTAAFGTATPLGQNSVANKPAFGQNAFGQASQPVVNASPFGGQQPQSTNANPFLVAQNNQPSGLAQQTQTSNVNANPFLQAKTSNPGQQMQNSTPNPFGTNQPAQQAPNANPNPFGTNQQPQQTQNAAPNPFGGAAAASHLSGFASIGLGQNNTPSQTPATSLGSNLFGPKTSAPAAAPSIFGAPTQPSNALGQAPSTAAQQGQPAAAAPATSGQFDSKDRLKEGKPEEYEGERGKMLEEIYLRVARTAFFRDDEEIPLTPPKCEWIKPVQ